MRPLGALLVCSLLLAALPSQTLPTRELPTHELPDRFEECSVGVACGRATADGRPLLWKNRDATARDNVIRAFDDGQHRYVALCNAGSSGSSVWGGANAAGFCIMNSVSRDLAGDRGSGPSNGPFMKLALQRCASVDEFEALLEQTAKTGRRTRANFGVIDALGGAAFFETGHAHHVRFDAADQDTGILLRTNFATTADGDRGRERFARAHAICRALPGPQGLDHRFLLRQFQRDLTPPPSALPGVDGRQDVRETIHRQTTVASMVFHGVRPDEPADLTTMWAVLGQPLFSIAVPCWPGDVGVSPLLSGTPEQPRSALCDAALGLQTGFYEEPLETAATPDDDEVAGAVRWLHAGHELAALAEERDAVEDEILARVERQRAAAADRLRELHDLAARLALDALRAFDRRFDPLDAVRIRGRIAVDGEIEAPWILSINDARFRISAESFDVTVPTAAEFRLGLELPGRAPLTRSLPADDVVDDTLHVPTLRPRARPQARPQAVEPPVEPPVAPAVGSGGRR